MSDRLTEMPTVSEQRCGRAPAGPFAGPVGNSVEAGPRQRENDDVINRRFFETSLDLILVVDRKGTFMRVSPSSEAIIGYKPDELAGRSAREILFPEDLDSTRREMRLARRGGVTRNFDCRYVHKRGHVVPLAWTGVWSEAEQQHFFIGRDMTERVKLEQELHRSQKLEAIGQLTGGIAHDFNNILTIIIGMNEIMAADVAGNPKLTAICKSIDEAAERGAQLAQRMLAFGRKQRLQARSLDLNESVASIAAMLKPTLGEHVRVEVALANDLWPALADPSQLENAIVNLAVNARDAMPGGGRLLIETCNVHLDEQYASENVEVAAGDYIAVVVSDTGTGMRPEVIERAFEPFFTTKDVGHGTGLGLSMVYGFARQSRGHVKIYSELGHGTSIKLYLPRAAGDIAVRSAAAVEAAAGTSATILVVEDDASVRAVAVGILEGLGYRVLQAGDGRAALEILQTPEKIDLLFSDVVMPNGLSGQDLLVEARALRPGLKALLASGYSERFIHGNDVATQGVRILNKPYRREMLSKAIREALAKPVE
jgi:PAS domain S-box-containing protein